MEGTFTATDGGTVGAGVGVGVGVGLGVGVGVGVGVGPGPKGPPPPVSNVFVVTRLNVLRATFSWKSQSYTLQTCRAD